jgi:hypothetical protein
MLIGAKRLNLTADSAFTPVGARAITQHQTFRLNR